MEEATFARGCTLWEHVLRGDVAVAARQRGVSGVGVKSRVHLGPTNSGENGESMAGTPLGGRGGQDLERKNPHFLLLDPLTSPSSSSSQKQWNRARACPG